jgi:hypothetical protein
MTSQRILANSVAKAGTYLLTRTIELLGNERFPVVLHGALTKRTLQVEEQGDRVLVGVDWPCLVPIQKLEGLLAQVEENQFIIGHLPFSTRVRELLERLNYKMVIVVRDPRDVVISHVNWALSREYLPYHQFYKSLPHYDRIMAAIHGFAFQPHGPVVLSLQRRFQHILAWQVHSEAHVTTFEKLVGPKGGGDLSVQLAEIKGIAEHLNLEASSTQLEFVAENTFGNTFTFKKGQSGRWRSEFHEDHKEAIKKTVGDYLVWLGYETDQTW